MASSSATSTHGEDDLPSQQSRDPEANEFAMDSTSSHGAAPQPSDMAMDSTAETRGRCH